MAASNPVIITSAVEGIVDEAILNRLIKDAGAQVGPTYGKKGRDSILKQLQGYNNAAQYYPWIVLIDLDNDECAPALLSKYLPSPAPLICFRITVREIEAWLLADRERIARFLSVAKSRIPINPESLLNPKNFMVELARKSRRRAIREDMVPRKGSGRREGPAYASRLIEFVQNSHSGWRPDYAVLSSDSLRRCIDCIDELVIKAKE